MSQENNLIIQALFNPDKAIDEAISEAENLIWNLKMIKAHGLFGANDFIGSSVVCSQKLTGLVTIISFLGQAKRGEVNDSSENFG